jgi:hypothetical protein
MYSTRASRICFGTETNTHPNRTSRGSSAYLIGYLLLFRYQVTNSGGKFVRDSNADSDYVRVNFRCIEEDRHKYRQTSRYSEPYGGEQSRLWPPAPFVGESGPSRTRSDGVQDYCGRPERCSIRVPPRWAYTTVFDWKPSKTHGKQAINRRERGLDGGVRRRAGG